MILCTKLVSHSAVQESQREKGREMEDESKNMLPEAYAMNRGDGPQSYAQNSYYQRGAVEAVQDIIKREIAKKLNIKQLSPASLNSFCIADFGCSTGPSTFLAVQVMLEAVDLKFQSEELNSQVPKFQVFFNDIVSNDFNTLFASLPPERQYYATGVPGSFYGRLFPKASLHFGYSSCALNWLSKVPKELTDKTSPAWNKGRIHYTSARKEVVEAYSAQFAEDMESFLHARAQELVGGGLIALILPGLPDTILFSQTTTGLEFELLGSCLMDMANMGLISEEKVDSFNLPVYFPSVKELEAVIEGNEHFTIERMEAFSNPKQHVTLTNLKLCTLKLRAVFDGIIEKHFGTEIMDKLFDQYSEKVPKSSFFLNSNTPRTSVLFVLLRRKMNA